LPGTGLVTLIFSEHDGVTTLTTTSTFDSREARDGVIESGMETGAAELYDRLEEHLRTMA
jgi:Activator of Hsp90 ATPase homolog 1-like protein